MPGQFFNSKGLPIGPTGLPRIEVKPFGNWEGTIRMVQQLGPNIKKASIKAQMTVCKEIVKRVKTHLRNQDLGWQVLDEEYRRRKKDRGLDGRTLIAYRTYYEAIQVWTKGSQHMVFVGVKKGMYGRTLDGSRNKIDVASIAALHEFSRGKKLPRRPLWNPTIREMGGAPGIKKLYIKELAKNLRAKGIPINQLGKIF